MNTAEVVKEFTDNLGPLEEKRVGNIQVNRRYYQGKLGQIELCVLSTYRSEHVYTVGIYWQPNPSDVIPDEADKFIWLEPYIQDLIEPMKIKFTTEELLLNSATKLGFYGALKDALLPEV